MIKVLFRGKRCDNGEWVCSGNLIHFNEDNEYYIPVANSACTCTHDENDNITAFDEVLFCKVIPETVGQFTGLADKHYKNIFEGDIISVGFDKRLMYVHFNGENLTWELTDVGVSACEVNHLYNTFDLGEIQVESCYGEMSSEVIGNIHDNPELLEKEV